MAARTSKDWLRDIDAYRTAFGGWLKDARRIVDRYRLEKGASGSSDYAEIQKRTLKL